jgi:Ca2+-binding RTX toxin-like protein
VFHSIVRRRHAASTLLGTAGAVSALALGLGLAAVHPEAAAAKDKFTAKIQHSTLVVDGTRDDETIVLRLRAGDPTTIEVATGLGKAKDFEFKLSKIKAISISGDGGDDVITIDESNGAITLPATIAGGSGNDIITAGSGNDTITGGAGDDIIQAGAGNDTITGGNGTDPISGGAGDDRTVGNPGDDTDIDEGGDGIDTVEVNGSDAAESFAATNNGTRLRFDRTDPAPFSLDIGSSEKLVVNANGGDDSFTGSNGLATLTQITVDGGAGNDRIVGGDGDDVLIGGAGDDFVDGNRGNDAVFLGAGDDTFQWDPGDGSDTVEGQGGFDTLAFNGSNIGEAIDLSANGSRLRLDRNVASVVMDVDGVETVNVATFGGLDVVTVGNLTGTAVRNVNVNLAATLGGGDSAGDTVVVDGTAGNDVITVAGDGTSVTVTGLRAAVTITGAEPALDGLTINSVDGDDIVNGSGLRTPAIHFTADGGAGDDVLIGGDGDDTLLGRDGDDVLQGGPGWDVLGGGTGNNVVIQ